MYIYIINSNKINKYSKFLKDIKHLESLLFYFYKFYRKMNFKMMILIFCSILILGFFINYMLY